MWGHRVGDRTASARANPTPLLLAVVVAASVGLAAIAASPGSARTIARRGHRGPRVTTSSPTALDLPDNGNDPLIQYDPVSGTTFVAWSNPQGSSGGVDLC